ncbi:MAG: hypothetical protein WD512_12250 [Candidatus Paceibacterota bacterium]
MNDKELINHYTDRAEKAEHALEIEREKVTNLIKKLHICRSEQSVINSCNDIEHSKKIPEPEKFIFWFRPWN